MILKTLWGEYCIDISQRARLSTPSLIVNNTNYFNAIFINAIKTVDTSANHCCDILC